MTPAQFAEGTLIYAPQGGALGFAWQPGLPDIEVWGVDTTGEDEGELTQQLPFALSPAADGEPIPFEAEHFIPYCKRFLGIPTTEEAPELAAPRDPGTVREALKLILAVSGQYANGGKLHDETARVKWAHEIGASMGSVTMAAFQAASKSDPVEIAKCEEVRDGFLWALAVLLGITSREDGVEHEPVFNVSEMTNHLSGGKQRMFLVGAFADKAKEARQQADDLMEGEGTSEAIEFQLGLSSAFEEAIKVMEIADLPFDNDQQVAGLFTPKEAKELLQDPNGLEGKRVLARLESLEELAS